MPLAITRSGILMTNFYLLNNRSALLAQTSPRVVGPAANFLLANHSVITALGTIKKSFLLHAYMTHERVRDTCIAPLAMLFLSELFPLGK
jgi:hypothetical protein